MHDAVAGTWGVSPHKAILQDICTDTVLAELSGNGIHLPSLLAVHLWTLSNVAWREDVAEEKAEVDLTRKGATVFFDTEDFDFGDAGAVTASRATSSSGRADTDDIE